MDIRELTELFIQADAGDTGAREYLADIEAVRPYMPDPTNVDDYIEHVFDLTVGALYPFSLEQLGSTTELIPLLNHIETHSARAAFSRPPVAKRQGERKS